MITRIKLKKGFVYEYLHPHWHGIVRIDAIDPTGLCNPKGTPKRVFKNDAGWHNDLLTLEPKYFTSEIGHINDYPEYLL